LCAPKVIQEVNFPKSKIIMYAVQNDTEFNFNIVLYIQVIFLGTAMGL